MSDGGAVFGSLTDAIGATPLIRLDRVTAGLSATVYVKAEFANPGGSVKDRAALAMITAAEASGALGPGATVFEGTSGNTGIGLAMVAARRGYRCVLVVPDRTAAEKIALLRAYGAEVVLTPGTLPQHDPRHVRRLAERLAAQTPGGWLADQYTNPANPDVHEATTGPELWAQTGGRITHLVVGVGTGGTVTGASRYLRKVSEGAVTIVGAEPVTSRYSGGDGSPDYVEAIGHYVHPATVDDEWPTTYDPAAVDRFERVGDREALDMVRRLAREEGMLVGGSSGTAVAAALRVAAGLGPGDVVVAIAPDSGRSYLSKYFDDDWMRRSGFLDAPDGPLVRDALPPHARPLVVARDTDTVAATLAATATIGDDATVPVVVDRVPVAGGGPDPAASGESGAVAGSATGVAVGDRAAGDIVGSVSPAGLRRAVAADPAVADDPVSRHRRAPLATVGAGERVADALARVPDDGLPLVVLSDGRAVALVERADLT
jgi:cystathionine beta-synthase